MNTICDKASGLAYKSFKIQASDLISLIRDRPKCIDVVDEEGEVSPASALSFQA